jgi:hypothetical protein
MVALPFERVAEREKLAPVLLSWSCAKVGSVVPLGAAIVIVPGETRPPLVAPAWKENEYLTCGTPAALEESVGAVTFVTGFVPLMA